MRVLLSALSHTFYFFCLFLLPVICIMKKSFNLLLSDAVIFLLSHVSCTTTTAKEAIIHSIIANVPMSIKTNFRKEIKAGLT